MHSSLLVGINLIDTAIIGVHGGQHGEVDSVPPKAEL